VECGIIGVPECLHKKKTAPDRSFDVLRCVSLFVVPCAREDVAKLSGRSPSSKGAVDQWRRLG
jgi:hypothetical protein